MTVGVGFQCSNGVVLCSDRQVTLENSYKFETRKILHAMEGLEWKIIYSYAGIADEGEVMFRRICESFRETFACVEGEVAKDKFRKILEAVYREGYESDYTPPFQTLIGFAYKDESAHLFRTSDRSVVDGTYEIIGVGDTSALRFLCEFLFDPERLMIVDEALVLGCYVIHVANRFVGKCGGGPDHAMIPSGGSFLSHGYGGPFFFSALDIIRFERKAGEELRNLLLSVPHSKFGFGKK
jgi:20S proteasome alpha/beta subunit